MALQMARMVLSELVHAVRPASFGRNVVANQGGLALAGIRSPGLDDCEIEDFFGPFWFAVPKKRVPLGKKRTRTADRTPRRIAHFSLCSKCGQPKLNHKFCNNIELCASDGSSPRER